jgi:hypothetical protein
MNLPETTRGAVPIRDVAPPPSSITTRQRDFLLLTIFVMAQHGYLERAASLAEALHMLGDDNVEVTLARTVLRFFSRDWSSALACLEDLDRIDPIERFGPYTMSDRQRMRRYVKARCLYELRQHIPARDAVESYLRHGAGGAEELG